MTKYKTVVGIDPDSEAHGVAIYKDGKLLELREWSLPEIVSRLLMGDYPNMLFSIEDMAAKKCVYRGHSVKKARPQGEIGRRVGMCQQAQIELMRMLDSFGVPYKLHKPQSGNWAETKNKPQFEQLTGWKKRSNKDTRSAAYFGWLEASSR